MSDLLCLRPDLAGLAREDGGGFTVVERAVPLRAKLDQNESAVDLPEALKRELGAELAAAAWNRYPQPAAYRAAKAAFAAVVGVAPEALALTVGGDQVIQAAFLLAGGPGRRARWFEPTYPYVALAARVTGTIADPLVLGLELGERLAAEPSLAASGELVVLVSPNNPTGELVAPAVVDAALADPARLVLLDEAYADFAGVSRLAEAPARPNLVIARSLSKAMCAGVRLGFAVAHPAIIAALERAYAAPYHLNALQLALAARYAEVRPHVAAAAARVRQERARLIDALAALPGVKPRPSEGNFVCFTLERPARALALDLAAAGVRVRDVSGLPGAGNTLRVTVGTPDENDVFLAEIRRLVE